MGRALGAGVLALVVGGCCLTSAVYPAPPDPVPLPAPPRLELAIPVSGVGQVVGWLDRAEPAAAPAVLYLHGNGLNLATLAQTDLLPRLRGLPAHVLAIDYPGYGRSAGAPSEASLVASARAALALLQKHYPQSALFVMGGSLGAAVAVQTAAAEGAAGGVPIAGVILVSPFSSLLDAAGEQFPRWLAKGFLCDRYDSQATAPHVPQPALVIHGARDRLVPLEEGRRVAARLPALRRLVVVEEAKHNDILSYDEGWAAIATFIRQTR
jgi:pimeloyl-ACP methyl ester carboxylesterase